MWHHSLLPMNSFNKTEAAVFSCRLCSMRAFPFISLLLLTTAGVYCLCGGCKKSPSTTSLCNHIFLVLMDHGVYMYVVYIWKWSSAHALGGVSDLASFITTDEQLQWNRGCCFLVQAMLPEGFPFHHFLYKKGKIKLVNSTCLFRRLTYYFMAINKEQSLNMLRVHANCMRFSYQYISWCLVPHCSDSSRYLRKYMSYELFRVMNRRWQYCQISDKCSWHV